ncbi:Clr5 domain-containing protein [Trichophaea hybrida]|nr:Clr5 domain-containing protein [Trichophaea hybrida]
MGTPAPPTQSRPLPPPTSLSIRNDGTINGWRGYRQTIRRLYTTEQRTLSEVRRIMQEEYNFVATPQQFKIKIKGWKMQKNIPKSKMVKILLKHQKRKNEGKHTNVYFHEQIVSNHKLNIVRARYQKELSQQVIGSPASSSISDIEFRTPQATGSKLDVLSPPVESIREAGDESGRSSANHDA